jgi:conjugal transfer pilus assembly protein TraK
LISLPAAATQVVDLRDCATGHSQVMISAHEQNRLSVEGRRIASVVPSQKDILSTVKDDDLGVLYFSLASTSANQGSVTLFVTDDQRATCKLILIPSPVPGDDIVIRPGRGQAIGQATSTTADRTLSYQRRVKTLMLAMAEPEDGQQRAQLERIAMNKVLPLWKEGRLILQFSATSGNLVGEQYRLTNISPSELRVTEQELYRKGVLAVAIEQHRLRPQEATTITLVRERRDHE